MFSEVNRQGPRMSCEVFISRSFDVSTDNLALGYISAISRTECGIGKARNATGVVLGILSLERARRCNISNFASPARLVTQ